MTLHKHHRKMRSQGGGGHPANILQITPDLHAWIHENPEVAYRHGLLVHSYDDPADVPIDIPGFLYELGKDHKHRGRCEVCGEELHIKPKRKNFEKGSEERRKRKRITVAVPADRENGGEVWDEIIGLVHEKLVRLGLYGETDKIPTYESIIAALYDWVIRD